MKEKKVLLTRVVAPSSVVPREELKNGLAFLESRLPIQFQCEAQVSKRWFFFSGSDKERAQGLERSLSSRVDLIWAARGGTGATRVLPLMKKTKVSGGKVYLGFSDSTSLMPLLRKRGVKTIHAPMIAGRSVARMKPNEVERLRQALHWASGEDFTLEYRLKQLGEGRRRGRLRGVLRGGNLSLLCALSGTPYQWDHFGDFLFLEETHEPLYRIDRMMQTLFSQKQFKRVKVIVLGEFDACEDKIPKIKGRALRRGFAKKAAFQKIFDPFLKKGGLVFSGLPVGHAECQSPLPIDARFEIELKHSRLKLL